ncbi:MAG: efflux RND transporter permease subunit [Chitinivibrionales bacterium]
MKKTLTSSIVHTLIRFRIAVIFATLVITAFMASYLPRLEVNNDPTKTIPAGLPERLEYEKLQKTFTSPRSILLIARFDSLALTAKVDSMRSWGEQFDTIDGIDNVLHVGTIQVPVSGGLFGLSSDYIVSRKKQLTEEQLRKRIRENTEFTQALISQDESVLGMMMDVADEKNQVDIVSQVSRVHARLDSLSGSELYITGAPLYAYSIDTAMRRDFSVLLPLCIVVVFILLYMVFKRLYYAVVSLLIISSAILWTFGLMSMFGFEFSVVTSMIPVILLPIGVASAIHVFKTYGRYSTEMGTISREELIDTTFSELMKPIFLSAVTTFVGFFSFAFSEVTWTRNFGIFTSIGVVLALFLSIILLPVALSYTRHKRTEAPVPPKAYGRKGATDFWGRYQAFIENNTSWLIVAGVIVLIGTIGFLRVRVEGNPIAMFSAENQIRKSDEIISEHLGGTRFLTIVIKNRDTTLTSAAQWQTVKEISEYAESLEMVGATTSMLPLIQKVSSMLSGKPLSDAAVSIVTGGGGLLGRRFNDYISHWLTEDKTTTRIMLVCKNVTGTRFLELSNSLQETLTNKYPSYEFLVAGPPVLNDAMTYVLIDTQLSSLLIAFISVFVVLCLLFRSIKIGAFAIIPIMLSTLFVYALMGFFGVAINAVTVIIVNTCIGIGIDYAIHFVAGYMYVRDAHRRIIDALMTTARNKGSVIMLNTFVVGIGFLVLAFSSFPPIRHFGLFVFLSMVTSSSFSLLFLPIFFRIFGEKQKNRS